ncbi:hypothetical protein [Enterococcus sp. 2201sp1_2201st1_B8_2201SCRN_220225]|uniref:hypothetical protein n=1 Tax=unclassified Enterococcus TaxID=2608891 RepID=UPI0034A2FBCD
MPQKQSQDIPVILIRDAQGNTVEKISLREWRKRKAIEQNENFEIKLYREALTYYGEQDFEKAEDLLVYLCELHNYGEYCYVERLANLYRGQQRPDKERGILLIAYRKLRCDPALARRIDKRLTALDAAFLPKKSSLTPGSCD